jgi:hypothetical protein
VEGSILSASTEIVYLGRPYAKAKETVISCPRTVWFSPPGCNPTKRCRGKKP